METKGHAVKKLDADIVDKTWRLDSTNAPIANSTRCKYFILACTIQMQTLIEGALH